jgi:energy-coupling factor transporter ATP-binding protein EcfA2
MSIATDEIPEVETDRLLTVVHEATADNVPEAQPVSPMRNFDDVSPPSTNGKTKHTRSGGRGAEKSLFGVLTEVDSIAQLVAADFRSDLIPESDLRPCYDWAIHVYESSDGESAPTPMMFADTGAPGHGGKSWADVLDEYGIDIEVTPDESVSWIVEELRGRKVTKKLGEMSRRMAEDIASAPVAERVDIALEWVGRFNDWADHLSGGTRRKLTLTALSTLGIEQTDWLWELTPTEGRIPLGELSLFGGREGLGKSTLASWMGAQLTRGTLPGNLHGTPKSVVIAATEDSFTRTITPRLMAAGADLDRVFRVDVKADAIVTTLNLPPDIAELEKLIVQESVGLIIIDPLTSALEETVDLNDYGTITNSLWPMAHMAQRVGDVAIVGIVHVNKSGGKDAGNLIMGSRAFNAVARASIMVMKHPEDDGRLLVAQAKNNLGRMDIEAMSCRIVGTKVGEGKSKDIFGTYPEWGDSDPRFITELLEASSKGPAKDSPKEIAELWLRTKLTDGPVSATDMKAEAEGADIKEHTLRNAKKDLGVITERMADVYPPQFMWRLPTEDEL